MARKLHIDFETFSSIDIKSCGAYKYTESVDFEILATGWAIDDGPVYKEKGLPWQVTELLKDPEIEVHAANAVFERLCLKAYGYDIPIDRFHCVLVKALYCGLAGSLEKVSQALNLGEKGKLSTGKALIRYFCIPCKPTKVNGMRTRNLPEHSPEKWDEFMEYLHNDVESEREAEKLLSQYEMPEFERINWIMDQEINDRGVLLDMELIQNAVDFDYLFTHDKTVEMKELTGLQNPNSVSQLKDFLDMYDVQLPSLGKPQIEEYLNNGEEVPRVIRKALEGRLLLSKSSVKKYTAMMNCECYDGRAHGLFQFYGANRTGRWAGRLIQLQNLPQNHMKELDKARNILKEGMYDPDAFGLPIPNVLSELIRTAIIAPEGHTFVVSDFSAIEARVLSWIAQEQWRLDVFNTHGKIYEASAAMMFNVPIGKVAKGSALRQRGKTAELALGYQGGPDAMERMDRDKVLSPQERKQIVKLWRDANPNIVELWNDVNDCAIHTITTGKENKVGFCIFRIEGDYFTIELPSGRKLYYRNPSLGVNRFGSVSICFEGMDALTKQWSTTETYGGKLVENIVQAISRDLLAYGMQLLREKRYDIVMHIHDEVVVEVPEYVGENSLNIINALLGSPVPWAEGLPLKAEGYETKYYMKD